jgi:hypothetical protein
MDKNIDFSLYPECDIQAAQQAVVEIKKMRQEKNLSESGTFEVIKNEKWIFNFIRSLSQSDAYLSRH